MQAVIKVGSTQYIVEPGQEVEIDHLTKTQKTLNFDQVLLLITDKDVQVGKPFVPGVNVSATFLADSRGEKVRVAKFKAKSRYRKAVGFRATYSRIKIDAINTGSTPVSPVVAPPVKARAKKSV
jgi:large subunit ribosomal protein L21